MKKKVCVLGLGYIGLPTAAVLARAGHDVLGVDVDAAVVETVNAGDIHIVEAGLHAVVQEVVAQGRLKASLTAEPADIFIIAVPTPMTDDKKPKLDYVESVARGISAYLQPGNLVILESTSPVGTTEKVRDWVADENKHAADGVHFVHCPERVLPGKILEELENNDRIIGGLSEAGTMLAIDFYNSFVKGNCLATTARTAEMSKLTENAFRDVNIAFANELSLICDEHDIDVWELIRLANRHPRVNILNPGPGVGGHCIAVDPWFIVDASPDRAKLVRTAREVNDSKPAWVVEKVLAKYKAGDFSKITCYGLAFKPNVDDFRESPALEIVKTLAKTGLPIDVVEPYLTVLPQGLLSVGNVALIDASGVDINSFKVPLVMHSLFEGCIDQSMPGIFSLVDLYVF